MRRRVAVALVLLASGCARSSPAPAAESEALLLTDDVAHWIHVIGDSLHAEQAPMRIARVGPHLLELFTIEDTREHEGAAFVVTSMYARNLVRGDSTLMFVDTVSAFAARDYAARHPEDPAVDEGDERAPVGDPAFTVESSIAFAEQVGPFLGIEIHVDRTRGDEFEHDTYWRTIDLDAGRVVDLAAAVGTTAAVGQRDSATRTLRQMLTQARQLPHDAATGRVLSRLATGPLDFRIVPLGRREPAVRWLAHTWTDAEVHTVALAPQAVRPVPPWWPMARRTLTAQPDEAHDSVQVGLRSLRIVYDTAGAGTIRHGRSQVRISGRVRQVLPLDSAAALPEGWRTALTRAFADAGYYAPEVRAVRARPRARLPFRTTLQ